MKSKHVLGWTGRRDAGNVFRECIGVFRTMVRYSQVIVPIAAAIVLSQNRLSAAEPAGPSRERLTFWQEKITALLDENVLPFWTSQRFRDEDPGGFLVYLDEDLQATGATDKHLIVHLRMLFNYGLAVAREKDSARRDELARELERQVTFLEEFFWDEEKGGWFWNLDREGRADEPERRMMVGEVYVVYVLSELFLLNQNERAFRLAEKTFELMDAGGHDGQFGGYFQDYRKGPYDPVNIRKNASTNLHMLLALSRLAEASPKQVYRDRLMELYELLPRFVHPESGHASWALTRQWEPIPFEEGINNRTMYGHNAELVWYMHEAAPVLERAVEPLVPFLAKIMDGFLRDGMSAAGAVYFFGPIVGPSDDKRVLWWAQAEAMVAFLRLYRLSGDEKYWEAFERVGEWTFRHVIPKDQPAAWWGVLDEDGNVTDGYRGGTNWKSGFHVARALFEIEGDLERLMNAEQDVRGNE